MTDYLSAASFNWIFTYYWSEDQMRTEDRSESWLDDTVNVSSYLDVILDHMVVWCKFLSVTVRAATFLHPPSPPLSLLLLSHHLSALWSPSHPPLSLYRITTTTQHVSVICTHLTSVSLGRETLDSPTSGFYQRVEKIRNHISTCLACFCGITTMLCIHSSSLFNWMMTHFVYILANWPH